MGLLLMTMTSRRCWRLRSIEGRRGRQQHATSTSHHPLGVQSWLEQSIRSDGRENRRSSEKCAGGESSRGHAVVSGMAPFRHGGLLIVLQQPVLLALHWVISNILVCDVLRIISVSYFVTIELVASALFVGRRIDTDTGRAEMSMGRKTGFMWVTMEQTQQLAGIGT